MNRFRIVREGHMWRGQRTPCWRASAGDVSAIGEDPHEAFWALIAKLKYRARRDAV